MSWSKIFREVDIGLHDDELLVREYSPQWPLVAEEEIKRIHHLIPKIQLEHIGSTAVPGLAAKPILDFIGCVNDLSSIDQIQNVWHDLCYGAFGESGIEGRRFYKLSDTNGITYVHLHVFEKGNPQIQKHIDFRDYLRSNPKAMHEYETEKRKLVKSETRATYNNAKNKVLFAMINKQQ